MIADGQQAPASSRAWTPAASRPSATTGSATTTDGSAASGRAAQRGDGAGGGRGVQEVVAVDPLPGEARRTGRPAPTVRESRVTLPVTTASAGPVEVAVHQRGHLGQRQSDHAGVPWAASDLAQDLAVVERVHGARHLLAGLVSLAGDQQRVAGAGQRDRGGDRRPPAADSSTSARRSSGTSRRRRAWPPGWRRGPRSAGCRR